MRPAKEGDGSLAYEYILMCIHDALVVSENAETTLRNDMGCYFELKEKSIDHRTIYLGDKFCKVNLDDGTKVCHFSFS